MGKVPGLSSFTSSSFFTILKALKYMPDLTIFEMNLDHYDSLDVCNSLINIDAMEIGERGARFIA